MIAQIRDILGRLHAEQSGAIALLLLASILILFLSALVIYDAGTAAQDKMDTQIGADSAAYSHSVVKARSMNMIAYANTIKRMIFSYLATYINAWLAILARWAYHASRCFRTFPDIGSCITWIAALPMIIAEGIELVVTNMPAMGGMPWTSDDARSRAELHALENYSQYMFAITPWWAYVEGVMRGMTNGALMTAAWPVPGSQLSQVNSAIAGYFGAGVAGMFPGSTNHTDVLPISRRDNDETWSSVDDPYDFADVGGDAISYCIAYAGSMESIVTGAQVILQSDSDPSGWKTWFGLTHLFPSIGCMFAAWSYSDDGYTDWRLKGSHQNRQAWLGATASLHVAYTPRAGRNEDNGGERQKFTYMTREAVVSDRFKNEGYFAMARSELVYKQPWAPLNTLEGWFSSVPIIGGLLVDRTGVNHYPDMWSPRWKAKNRPMILPGERFGSAVNTAPVGLNVVTRDVIPYLALGSIVGIVGPQGGDPPFSIASAVDDFIYLYRSGQSWGTGQVGGIAK